MLEAMPHEQESEIGLLGSILMTDSKDIQDSILPKLTPDCFWIRSHRLIWEAIVKLSNENAPMNIQTVTVKLRESGKIDEVGGIPFVTSIALATPVSTHAEYFIERILEKKKLRDLIETSTKIIQKAQDNQPSSELISSLEAGIDEMTKDGELAFQNQLKGASEDLKIDIQLRREGKGDCGMPSGIKSFDDAFFGFKQSQYYVIAGRPSAGKTAFADQCVLNLIKRNEPVLYIGLESDRKRILGKLSSKLAQVNYFNYSMMKFSQQDYQRLDTARQAIEKMPLNLVTPPDLHGSQIRSLMRKASRRDGCKVCVLDYIQHIACGNDQDERIAIAQASLQIQRGCIETGMSAIVLCQINRMGADGERPKMSQLKGSGQLEQDADNIVLLWAEKEKQDLEPGEFVPVVMTIEKNKDGPNGIDSKLFFDGAMMTFREREIFGIATPQSTPYKD